MPRSVLYIGFWGVDDPLTRSTVMPSVRELLAQGVDRVRLCTVERSPRSIGDAVHGLSGVEHLPLMAATGGPKVLDRALDSIRMVRRLRRIVAEEDIGLIIARTSLAGALAAGASQGRLPYVVESFEPHADYMVDCGVWSDTGVLATVCRRQERAQMRKATFLLPVTRNYATTLMAAGVGAERIRVVPCPVDLDRFRYDPVARRDMRAQLGVGDARVGIYVGKFGGLYHTEHAYRTFAAAHRHWHGQFKLVLLTPEPEEQVRQGLKEAGFPAQEAIVRSVPHQQVPDHLSAADVGFALYRSTPSSAYISPVKIGEYWANGLPVLLTRGVADDSDIIAAHPEGGALFDPESDDPAPALDHMAQLIAQEDQRARTTVLAGRFRSPEFLQQAYRDILAQAFSK